MTTMNAESGRAFHATEPVRTSTFNKINRFLAGTARRGQFAAMFGPTGRGKTFLTRAWAVGHEAVYLRARTGTTQVKLRRQISEALFGTEHMTESAIIKYFVEHPGCVLIIDEAVHLIGDYTFSGAKTLDSIRDIYDEVQESGGRFGVVFIFTDYTLKRLRECRLGSFLGQFINRFGNHLQIEQKVSFAYEIVPTVRAYFPEADDDILAWAKTVGDLRELHKLLALSYEEAVKFKEPVTRQSLEELQAQFETGEYPDEMEE